MKFHGFLLTRDDQDVIDECISHALTWCDALYVFDTGSSDHTWEQVQAWAAKDVRVVPLRKCRPAVMMSSPLRGYVFDLVRNRFQAGDWFVQQDVDEFYHVAPPEFVKSRLRTGETAVYNQHYEFRITRQEVSRWIAGDETVFDRRLPIHELRRSYYVLAHSEPRMFRYRPSMQWGSQSAYPWNMGYIARARIPIRHYPHRDPLSLQSRLCLRNHLLPLSKENWSHWAINDWRKYLADENDADLRFWEQGSQLPEVFLEGHLCSRVRRCAQWLIHRALLRVLDSQRTTYPTSFGLPIVPTEVDSAAVADLQMLRAGGISAVVERG